MSEFKLGEFDPAESQLFLTSIKLYNLRSEKTFAEVMRGIPKLRVDGMLTKQGYRRSSNVYNQTHGVFIVNDMGYKARFDNFRKPKTMFNFTDKGELCLMLIHSLMLDSDELEKGKIKNNDELFEPIKSNTNWGHRQFSFVLNTKLPSVDILAARLMMDE